MIDAETYYNGSVKNMLNNFRNDVKWLERVAMILTR